MSGGICEQGASGLDAQIMCNGGVKTVNVHGNQNGVFGDLWDLFKYVQEMSSVS